MDPSFVYFSDCSGQNTVFLHIIRPDASFLPTKLNYLSLVKMSNTHENNNSTTSTSAARLGLPAPSDAPASGEPNNVIKLDHLGPMIVNSDGTISRIASWQNMSEIEKERSLRLLAKRNNARMETLKSQQKE